MLCVICVPYDHGGSRISWSVFFSGASTLAPQKGDVDSGFKDGYGSKAWYTWYITKAWRQGQGAQVDHQQEFVSRFRIRRIYAILALSYF